MDDELLSQLSLAKDAWTRRSMHDHDPIKMAYRTLKEIQGKAQDPLLNYDILILLCQVMRWMAWDQISLPNRESNSSFYYKITDVAKEAITISDAFSEAYFYYADSLSWLYCSNLAPIFDRPTKEVLFNSIDDAIFKPTRTHTPGIQLEGYGPHRLKGEILTHDRSSKEALEYLELAYNHARNFACNAVSYANALIDVSERTAYPAYAQAKVILEDLLKNDPHTFNPTRIPETQREFQLASSLLKQPPFVTAPPHRIDEPLHPST